MLSEKWTTSNDDADDTIQLLNRSFGGGWDALHFDWYLARPFDGHKPDRLTIGDDDAPAAGSAVNYRTIRLANGDQQRVGIASGSWTLPDYRKRGLFSRMMSLSVERAASKGCDHFLAFVTADNASCNALTRLGADMIPATYLVSNDSDNTGDDRSLDDTARITPANVTAQELFDAASDFDGTQFHYRSADVWAEQFLARPNPVDVLRVGDSHFAIVERVAGTDRLQWTSAPATDRMALGEMLARRAAALNRKFFMYATGPTAANAGLLVAKPGFIACLPTGSKDSTVDSRWDVQSGDRM